MAAQLQPQNTVIEQEIERDERRRKEELNSIANKAEAVGFDTGSGFLHLQRVAQVFATSDMVPKQYQKNLSNCCIAINLARRLHADELMVMQNLYIVYGRPGWSSKFLIAMFNQTGKFTPIAYQFVGKKGEDSYGCRAVCANRETGEQVIGPDVTIAIAKAEGWYDRKKRDSNESASKWPTMTDLMLRYRAAAWMINTTAPELTMGIGTVEEHIDTGVLLDEMIEETERRKDAKNAAFANSPSKEGVILESEKEAEKPQDPPPIDPPKQSSTFKKSQAAASAKPLENPNFGEGSDPDPGPNFGA